MIEGLVITERVEFIVPGTFILMILIAFYGPNAYLLGNIKLTLWHFQEIKDIQKLLEILSLLLAIDFTSFIINASLLWVKLKVNAFIVLQKVQSKLWIYMAIIECCLFWEVCLCNLLCFKYKAYIISYMLFKFEIKFK